MNSIQQTNYLDDDVALQRANAINWQSNDTHADDDQAIIKANSMTIEQQLLPAKRTIIRMNKTAPVGKFKAPKNFNDMGFDELSEVYATERTKIKEFFSLPEEARAELKDMLQQHYKRMTAARIALYKVANPDQTLLLTDYEEMKVALAKRPAGAVVHTEKHVNHLKKMNSDLIEKNRRITEELKEANIRLHSGAPE